MSPKPPELFKFSGKFHKAGGDDRAEDQYYDIINNHPDLICEWLPDGSLIFANEAYCQYFGKSLDDLLGKSCLDYIHPDDRDKFNAHLSQLSNTQDQAVIELKIIDSDGQVRWQQWIDKVVYDETTQEIKFLSSGRDVTDLKKAEIELKERIAFERLIADLSINFINIAPGDFDRRITHVLSEIGRFAGVDRSYVFIYDNLNNSFSNTHEWCDQDISPQIQNNQNITPEMLPWVLPKLGNFSTIHIPEVDALDGSICPEKKIFMAQDIQSILIVPLVNSGELIGFIGFDSVRDRKTWSNDEATILRIVGSSIGSAIVQIQHTKALALQKHYLEKLNELTSKSLNAKSVEEMLNITTNQIKNLVSAQECSIFLWNDKHKKLNLGSSKFSNLMSMDKIIHKETGQSFVEEVIQSKRTLFIGQKNQSETSNNVECEKFSSKSILGIPLHADDTRLGVVVLSFDQTRKLSNDEISLAEQATSQIAQAMLKLHLVEQAQQSAREAETLHRAGTIVASALEPEVAVEFILDQLSRVVPFDTASVQLLVSGHLEIKAGKGWPVGTAPIGMRFPIPGNNPNTRVIQTRKPHVLNNAPQQFKIFADKPHSNILSWLGVPLVVHNRVIGMLALDHHQQDFYDDPKRIDLVTAFADQVAISLENARLYAEEHQRVIELDALRATTADITQELALENLLTAILERATDLLGATGGELGLIDEEGNIRILVSHNMGAENVNTTIEFGEGLMGHVAQRKTINMIEDYQHWSGQMETYKESQIHAAIAAPLMIGNRLLGVIGIMNSDKKRKFSKSEYSLMNLFAQQAAIAVENAKLFEESKRQARIDLTTELYNRRGLFELGEREIDRSKRYKRPLSALMIDIDHFKSVNDTHGHHTGDLVLKELAQRLKISLRTIDILARYGGEEFVILLPETSLESAVDVAERLREIVAAEAFLKNDLFLDITISLGVAVTQGKIVELQTLIKHADNAMYQSKGLGRDRVTQCTHTL